MVDIEHIEPRLTPAERDEMAHIVYFLAQWDALRVRKGIPDETYVSVAEEYAGRREALVRQGRYQAALFKANNLARMNPRDALVWADRAREIDPERPEAWALAIDLNRKLRQDDQALALCEEATPRFPELQARLVDLRREHEARPVAVLLEKASEANTQRRDEEAIGFCENVLAIQPDQYEALVLLAFSHQRLGHLDEALALYLRLESREPENPVWNQWVRNVRGRMRERGAVAAASTEQDMVLPGDHDEAPLVFEPDGADESLSWRGISGEFLQDHWQKLILCLAVLLIVVSSNVGIYQLIGPQLWSPLGKCVLALVYTAMCAGFGTGLLRWGAERAGRVMLLTTLIVVPVNLMLAGEIRLLTDPSAFRLTLFTLDAVALFTLIRTVTAALALKRDGWFLSIALFTLSAFNATTARGVWFEWGFAALILSACVYLALVWWLNTRGQDETGEEPLGSAYFVLGLLTFTFLTGAVRTGLFVLAMPPTLYAVPVMLLAIACVHTAHHLARFEKDPRQVFVLRFVGLVLSGIAFALALARPPGPSPLLSGNTLATALLGLGLYAGLLRVYRHPAYLYFAFGALFLGYFGAYYFAADLIRTVEEGARRALGYEHKLPTPFKAINGLVFNVVLALLSRWFARRWQDERLARQCHYLGVPFSIAACVLSAFEPTAAAITLSGYTVLYAAAIVLFEAPLVTYLACAALTAAAYFGSTLVPGMTAGAQALIASGLGFFFWSLRAVAGARRIDERYRVPLQQAALATVMLTMFAGLSALTEAGDLSLTPALAFGLAALLCALLDLDESHSALVYLAALNADISYGLLMWHAESRWNWSLTAIHYGVGLATAGLILAALAEWLKRRHARDLRGGDYAPPVFPIAIAQVALSLLLCLVGLSERGFMPGSSELGWLALALALCTAAKWLFLVSDDRLKNFEYDVIATGVGAYSAAVLAVLTARHVESLPAALAIALGLLSLLLYGMGTRLMRRSEVSRYAAPILHMVFVTVGVNWLLCGWNWDRYPFVAVALALSALALGAASREFPVLFLAELSLAALFGVWLCLVEIVAEGAVLSHPAYGLSVMTFALLSLAAGEWARWRCRVPGFTDPEFAPAPPIRAGLFARALPAVAAVCSILAVALAVGRGTTGGPVIATLGLAAVAMLWMTRFRRELVFVYLGIGHAVAAALFLSAYETGWRDLGNGLVWLALTSALVGLTLTGLGRTLRRQGISVFYAAPCLEVGLLLTAAAFMLALDARLESRITYHLGMIALLINAITYVLLATFWRHPALTFAAAFSFVSATYLGLLSPPHLDPKMAYLLGLAAALEAILLWSIGILCRRSLEPEWDRVIAVPLFVSALVLAILAVPAAYASPVSMVLVAIAFLLMVKSFPRAEWLYPALAALGCAAFFAFLEPLSPDRLIAAVMGFAYLLWVLGVLLRRVQPWLLARIDLSGLSLEFPCFNAAVLVALIAAWLRIDESIALGLAWSAHAGLPLALALLCLLMLRAYPHQGWVHAAVGLVTLGVAMGVIPRLTSPLQAPLAGMVLAHGWYFVMRGVRRVEAPWCARLGVEDAEYAQVIGLWSSAFFGVVVAVATYLVVFATIQTVFTTQTVIAAAPLAGWGSLLLTLSLAGVYILVAGPRHRGDEVLMSLFLVATLAVWWIGAPTSPLVTRLALPAAVYQPVATALLALATAAFGTRFADKTSSRPRSWLGEISTERVARLDALAANVGFGLALIASAFTLGALNLTTIVTLILATLALRVLAVTRERVDATIAGGLLWCGACVFIALRVARWRGWIELPEELVGAAVAGLVAAFALFFVAGVLRGPDQHKKVVRAFEAVALAATLATAGAVLASRTSEGAISDAGVILGVGVLLGISLFQILLAPRWQSESLVYAAQAFLLGAYLNYRAAFPVDAASDAALLTLLAYLDLGIAEVMQRLRLNLYARPTLYSSLVMPLIPLGLMIWNGSIEAVNLFYLFTAATFYGIACFKMQWKPIGYAAAVLFNAFLWVVWARVGYKLADHSQFYLIPVGLSAILFAEVNRRELGRMYVNAIREIGLIIIYLSLAVPIWQFQSFGAWLTLLLLSLTGIFAGIGLRVKSFLWMGLVCFVLDVVYQLGRLGMENALAKWGIMLALGIVLFLFVALNEKKRIVVTMREYLDHVRQWE